MNNYGQKKASALPRLFYLNFKKIIVLDLMSMPDDRRKHKGFQF